MNPKPHHRDPDTFSLFGLRVGRKTEIIALAAFTLSIGGLVVQAVNLVRGAAVQVFPSDQIVISSTNKLGRRYVEEQNRVAFIAAMDYVNTGDVGYNAVIRQERIVVSAGGRPIEHRWYEFGSSDIDEAGALVFKRDTEARPFPINAGSAVSHETLFTPWEIDCAENDTVCDPRTNYWTWDAFLQTVKATPELTVTTTGVVYGGRTVTATCVVRLRPWEIDVLERVGWLAPACIDTSAGGQVQRKGPEKKALP